VTRLSSFLAALSLAAAALAQDAPLPGPVEKAARDYITRAALEAPIRFLSSDMLEGRDPARAAISSHGLGTMPPAGTTGRRCTSVSRQ
jgi:hypothetical protein